MKKIYTLFLPLFLLASLILAQPPVKPPVDQDIETETWESLEEEEEEDDEADLSDSGFEVDKSTFRVKQDAFNLHNLLTETDWPENWEGEETLKEYGKQIAIFDFTAGFDQGIALQLLDPYLSYLDDPKVSIMLYFTDEEVAEARITTILESMTTGSAERSKKILVWLHHWPDDNLGILVINPIEE